MKLRLGTVVRFKQRLGKSYDGRVGEDRYGHSWKPFPGGGVGIVVGTRTLKNGSIKVPESREPLHRRGVYFSGFQATESVPAVLVATHIRRKHVLVHQDDIEIVQDRR